MRSNSTGCMTAFLGIMVLAFSLPAFGQFPTLYEIAPVGSSTSTQGRAITPDGKFVVGTGSTEGFIWDAVGGSRIMVAGGTAAHDAVGVGYRTYNGELQIVAFGNSTGGTVGPTYWISDDNGAGYSFSPKLRRTGTGADYPAANAVAGSSLQADAWYDVWDGDTGTGQLWIEKGSGPPALPQQDTKGVPNESRILGVSSTGLAVGWRRDDGGNHQGYVLQHDGDGGTSGNYYPNGMRASPYNRYGQLWAIAAYSDASDNRAGGMGPVDGGRAGNWPYIVDDYSGADTGTATELPTFNPTAGYATNGIVYGLSEDGRYAVGMDYTLGNELAVLWDLVNLGSIVEVNLTQFAADNGILGDFTGNLRRAYAVGVNASGQPVITGWGWNETESAVRGYVLTISESGCADPFADADRDDDVDQADFGIWQACFSGTGIAHPVGDTYPCVCFNRDGDTDVDGDDFNFTGPANDFLDCWSGPTVPAVTSCDGGA